MAKETHPDNEAKKASEPKKVNVLLRKNPTGRYYISNDVGDTIQVDPDVAADMVENEYATIV